MFPQILIVFFMVKKIWTAIKWECINKHIYNIQFFKLFFAKRFKKCIQLKEFIVKDYDLVSYISGESQILHNIL